MRNTFLSFVFVSCCAAQQSTPLPADPNNVMRVETNVVLVDAVVTDKKGNYVRDLKQKDFKVWEDNKEQTIKSFSFEADPASPLNSQPRYLVLFFDNSTLAFGDQAQARKAAVSFIDANVGPNRLMAIVNYSGGLEIAQNFTADAERLKAIAGGTKIPVGPSPNESNIAGGLGRAAGNFGARNMILGIRELAKNLATIPGRKTLVLLTAGFKVSQENLSEVTATIDVCNRSNVAIYPIDVRGLVAGHASVAPQLFSAPASPFINAVYQVKGGGTSGSGVGSSGSGAGSHSGGPSGSSGSGSGGRSGSGSSGSGSGGTTRSSSPGGVPMTPAPAARMLVPKIPESASTNQQLMYMLADGTGGFVIINTNDLLGGMQKIAKEMNEFYLIGYTPTSPADGKDTCHTIRVKVDHGDNVRARSGYCNVKMKDVLAQTSTEKTLESRAAMAQAGNIAASMQAPYFYTGSNVARVNVAMDIPPDSLKFAKEKGKLRSTINVLGIAYKADGSVGARFSDAVKIEFENEKEVEAFQQRPYHYENQFDVATGQYNLKVVFGAGGESFGKLEQPLVIDAYDVKKFSVSSLALSTKFQKTGLVDEGLETALLEDRTPLIAQGYQLTPAGSAKFKKTDRVAMYFEIYEPGLMVDEVPKSLAVGMEVRAFDAKGVVRFDTGGLRIPLPEKGGNPTVPWAIVLPLANLEPGSYKVVLGAIDDSKHAFERTTMIEVQ